MKTSSGVQNWLPPMALAFAGVSWVAGIWLGSYFHFAWAVIASSAIPAGALFFAPKSARPWLLLFSLCLLLSGCAMLRSGSTRVVTSPDSIGRFNDEAAITINGTITKEPDLRGSSTTFLLSVQSVTENESSSAASGVVLVRSRPYPQFRRGDQLELTGKIKSPAPYAKGQGAVSTMDYPTATLLHSGTGVADWFHSLRSRMSNSIAGALPQPQSSLAQAILLGDRQDIPLSLTSAFARTGTTHLLAISGMNISMFSGMLLALAIWVLGKRRFLYIWAAVAGVWFYSAITGLDPPVLRAAVMATIFLLGVYLGRQGSAMVAITVAAAVMVGFDPSALWSVSFQLSFFAMAGLIIVTPVLQALLETAFSSAVRRSDSLAAPANFLAASLATTLGATVATLPLLAHYFGILSPISLLANLTIIPVLPVIMLCSGAVALAGLVSSAAATLLGYFAWPFLTYMIGAVETFSKAPMASLNTGYLPWAGVAAYYAVLLFLLAVPTLPKIRKKLPDRLFRRQPTTPANTDGFARLTKWASLFLAAICVFVWISVLTLPENKLRVTFLDVGNGDSILITTPDGKHLLIDGGPDPQTLGQRLGSELPPWDKTIDLVVLTHPHADHLTGLLAVVATYNVKQVLEAGIHYDSALYQEWQAEKAKHNIPTIAALSGQKVDMGDSISLTVLHSATPGASVTDANHAVLVTRLDWKEISFLFTGDAEQDVEREMIEERKNLNATVLKVGHHGSATSSSQMFLTAVRPGVAAISVAAGNGYALPAPQVISRLAAQLDASRIFTTADRGTIRSSTDGYSISIETERD